MRYYLRIFISDAAPPIIYRLSEGGLLEYRPYPRDRWRKSLRGSVKVIEGLSRTSTMIELTQLAILLYGVDI